MIDSFDKLADIIKEKEKLEQALNLACRELEDKDSMLYDLFDRLDTYYDTKDKHEWKKELLESVIDNE